jgi:hypothetical protein
VLPVEIDIVGLQPRQGAVELGDDRLAAGPACIRIVGYQRHAELGGKNHTLAPAGIRREIGSERLLGLVATIEIGGIDEVASKTEVAVENCKRICGSSALVESHRSEGEGADPKAA